MNITNTINHKFRYFLIIIGSILSGLILIELSFRIVYLIGERQLLGLQPLESTITWKEDPDIGRVIFTPNSQGWFVTPTHEYFNYLKINSLGFYDSEHAIIKPNNTFRIVILGDSFVASSQTQLKNTFFRQLENYLNNLHLNKKIEIIAMGMGDTGTAQQYIALKKIALKYQPDLVIHMFLTANDLKNNSPKLQQDPYRPYFEISNNQLVEIPHQHYLSRKYNNLRSFFENFKIVEFALYTRQQIQTTSNNKHSDYPVDYHVYDQDYNPDYSNSWLITQQLILASRQAVESIGGKYLLVTEANNEQVNDSLWNKLKSIYPKMQSAQLDLAKPDKLISSFCQTQSINCLQMLPAFLSFHQQYPNILTHYVADGHWNQIGTDLAAKILENYMYGNLPNYGLK